MNKIASVSQVREHATNIVDISKYFFGNDLQIQIVAEQKVDAAPAGTVEFLSFY